MSHAALRNTSLRKMLGDRRRRIQGDFESRMREGRTDRLNDGRDDLEVSDADIQADLDLALLQMRGETLVCIDEALVRIEAGEYGTCCECAGRIPEGRLHAQPFAVRCLMCEERRERKGRFRPTVGYQIEYLDRERQIGY